MVIIRPFRLESQDSSSYFRTKTEVSSVGNCCGASTAYRIIPECREYDEGFDTPRVLDGMVTGLSTIQQVLDHMAEDVLVQIIHWRKAYWVIADAVEGELAWGSYYSEESDSYYYELVDPLEKEGDATYSNVERISTYHVMYHLKRALENNDPLVRRAVSRVAPPPWHPGGAPYMQQALPTVVEIPQRKNPNSGRDIAMLVFVFNWE